MWKQLKSGLISMISDVDNQISSKRIITLIFVLTVLITWSANLFFTLQVTEFIFNGLLYMVGMGLGVTASEKFSSRGVENE